MKKYFVFLLLSLVAVSCYEDYITDYTYDGIYFPYQVDVRTFVVGEGMKIQVGATLGGVRENDRDRNVNYTLDNTLISANTLFRMQNVASDYIRAATATVPALAQLPANYYTISDNAKMVIKAGQHSGSVVITADSAAFLADAATLNAKYVLPFRITSADADSVVTKKNYNVVGFKYENMLFGNYWHGGVAVVKDAGGNTLQTITYYTTIPMVESKIWKLTTVAPNELTTNGFGNQTFPTVPGMKLTLNGNDVVVSAATGAPFIVQPDGSSTFNRAKLLQNRKIFLKYKYTDTSTGNTYYCTDTLTFRNRIRDGINEWQDENPSHYTK